MIGDLSNVEISCNRQTVVASILTVKTLASSAAVSSGLRLVDLPLLVIEPWALVSGWMHVLFLALITQIFTFI